LFWFIDFTVVLNILYTLAGVPLKFETLSSTLVNPALCTTLCDKVCQWFAAGRWLSPDPPVSSYIMKVISEKHRTLLFRYLDTYVSTYLLYYSFTAVFIKFKIYTTTMLTQLYVKVRILFGRGKYLHGRITSLSPIERV
jgi:hypothetical protein